MAFFLVVWIVASIARPLLIVSLLLVASKPSAAIRKVELLGTTLLFLIASRDKTWKKPPKDPDSFFTKDSTIQRKTIVFLRHGESTWNDTFNKGDRSKVSFLLYFGVNLAKAIAYEWYFWISGQDNDSWFYDSPLSPKGLHQALQVQKFLQTDIDHAPPKEAQILRLLTGKQKTASGTTTIDTSSQLVSSNLRRAISTMVVGFQDRLLATHNNQSTTTSSTSSVDNILILDCLQEISRNPDALSITPPHGQVLPAFSDPPSLHHLYSNEDSTNDDDNDNDVRSSTMIKRKRQRIDTRLHTGNKAVSSNGLVRMKEFCSLVFDDYVLQQKSSIIVAGHSLWFRSFFQTYLPYTFDHVSKKKKLVNGGLVAFVLERTKPTSDDDDWAYRIDPKSLVVLHGGF